MYYTVRYYDRNPLDPKARWDIHRENVKADTGQEAAEIMTQCDKEVIDVKVNLEYAPLSLGELIQTANEDPAHIRYADPFEGESTPFVWGGDVFYPANSHRNSAERNEEDMPL